MWKWLNPWRELCQAREQIAALEAECDALDREARDARRAAYAEAHEHYEMRTKALQASHDQLLQRCVDIQNMTPPRVLHLDSLNLAGFSRDEGAGQHPIP